MLTASKNISEIKSKRGNDGVGKLKFNLKKKIKINYTLLAHFQQPLLNAVLIVVQNLWL